MKLLRLFAAGFSMSLRRTMTFRTNLFFDVALAAAGLATALGTVLLVFTRTDRLAGWTRTEVIVLVGTFQILTGIKATFIDPNLAWFPVRGIREGTLDTYLMQPAPSLFLASLSTAAPLALVETALGAGVVAVGVSGDPPGPVGVLAWLLLLAVGAVVTWALGVLLACLAFWAPRLELEVFYGAAWQLGRYPTDVYRRPLRLVLTYVLPLTLIATLPASVLLRDPDPAVIAGAVAAAAFAWALATGLWRWGLRRYTGATS
ncbi:ABC transporter permease [Virgisporangium ochraceum]|uniref:ABC transporter permease n=1 Tax=Virgisporangium ochraceum TaxID=65505 RepID=A0A8J4EFQ0_9ACTN|nr:ABC-2 family transporter protein [Virgisporangium ochraceum]GIJ73915.1 ABC transporter permease [Virgisporangium ochraceum]